MIVKEIDELIKYISRECKVQASFGLRDLAPDEYPHVQVTPDQSFSVTGFAAQGASGVYPVTLKIIVDRKAERDAITILDRMFCTLGEFTRCKGHEMSTSGNSSYTESTFQITIPFNLRFLTQGVS